MDGPASPLHIVTRGVLSLRITHEVQAVHQGKQRWKDTGLPQQAGDSTATLTGTEVTATHVGAPGKEQREQHLREGGASWENQSSRPGRRLCLSLDLKAK